MKKILLILLIFLNFFAFSEKTQVENLYEYKLDNGLELFVAENDIVPLVYIEIAVKCGSYTQEKNTSGLFHLFEHMMFKGNSKYKSAQDVNKALSDLGATSWNGTTGLECVNYYFTIPKEQLKNGLIFWSEAIRNPLLNKKELESEKKVVLSEIQRDYTDSGKIISKKINEKLFKSSPWKMSPGGSLEVVENATVNQLKKIQKEFYIPNNSAVFVGGDVDSEEVYKLVQEIFGDWKKQKTPQERGKIPNHSKNPLEKSELIVFPYDKISKNIFQVGINFRGPDAFYDLEDTYAFDMIFQAVQNPQSYFKRFFVDFSDLGIPEKDYISAYYATYKTCGKTSFSAIFSVNNEKLNANFFTDKAEFFADNIYDSVKKTILELSEDDFSVIKQRLKDDLIFSTETSSGLLQTLRGNWVFADSDYFYSYNQNMQNVTKEKMLQVLDKYIKNLNPLIYILINPEIYNENFEN